MPKDMSSIPFKADPPQPPNVVTSKGGLDSQNIVTAMGLEPPPAAKALAKTAIRPPPRVNRMWREMFVENENWGTSPVEDVDDNMIEAFITAHMGIDFSPMLFQRRELKRLCEIEANLRHAISHAREALSPSSAVNLEELDDSLVRRIRTVSYTHLRAHET